MKWSRSVVSNSLWPRGLYSPWDCKELDKTERLSLYNMGLIPGLGRSLGEGKGYPFQYSGLENSMDYTVHGVTKSWTRLSDFTSYIHLILFVFFIITYFFLIILFIYYWLHWVFIALCGLSLCVVSGATLHCSARVSHWSGFSCCRAQALGTWASAVAACRLGSWGSQALERELSSCGAWA